MAHIFFIAIPIALGSLAMFLLYYAIDLRLARTMTFICLSSFQWFNAGNCRSETQSLFKVGLLTNKWFISVTGLIITVQLFLLHVPWLQTIFHTQPLNIYQWIFALIIGGSIILIDESRKWLVRRYAD